MIKSVFRMITPWSSARALPKASETPDPNQRADVVVQSNRMLTGMIDRLATIPLAGTPEDVDRDRRIYDEWIADWRVYVSDRDDYANRLRSDREARIFVTQKGAKQITEPIGGFAKSNQMPACQPPGDIF